MTGEALDATRSVVSSVGHDVPVLRKRYLELVRTLVDRAQKTQGKLKVTTIFASYAVSWLVGCT